MPIISHTAGGGGGAPGGGDSTYTDTYANIPAASNDGDLFFPSDGAGVYRDTGAAWASWGPLMPFTEPPSAGWSWVNQGSATIDATKGGIYLEDATGVATEIRGRFRSISAPYVVTAAFLRRAHYNANEEAAGICFRQSSDGKLITFQVRQDYVIQVTKFSSPGTGVANYISTSWPTVLMPAPVFVLRIEDDNTNRKCYWSGDGQHFTLIHTVGRTDYLTADEVGFNLYTHNAGVTHGEWLLSWAEA